MCFVWGIWPRSSQSRDGAMGIVHSSRYLGVRWIRQRRRWSADLYFGGRELHIASFDDEQAAAEAHDRLALHYLGSAAKLNFPRRHLVAASLTELRHEARQWKSSRFRGVFFNHRRGRWDMQFRIPGGGSATITGYETEEAAARAHDRAALHYLGPKAQLNFPSSARFIRAADVPTLAAEKRRAFKANTTSRFRGVSWDRQVRRWRSCIKVGGQPLLLGYYDDEEAAAFAYDAKALDAFGRAARPNFHPETGEELCGERTVASLGSIAARASGRLG